MPMARSLRKVSVRCAALAAFLHCLPAARSAPIVTPIVFSNFAVTSATGISSDGTVVSGTASSVDGESYIGVEAIFSGENWVEEGLGLIVGDPVATCTAVAPEGNGLVGYNSEVAILNDGAIKNLEPLPNDDTSAAYGVSSGGVPVVGVSEKTGLGGGSAQAVIWSTTGTALVDGQVPVSLPFITNYNSSVAYGVTCFPLRAVGYCTQYSGYNDLDDVAFIWKAYIPSGTPGSSILLGHPNGYTASLAVAISEDGETVVGAYGNGSILASGLGGAQRGTSGRILNSSQACYWKPDDGSYTGGGGNNIYPLSTPAGDNYSIAAAVSANGSYVVGSSGVYSDSSDYFPHAIIWSLVDNKRYDLQNLLQTSGADLTGWSSLFEATGVSADGDIVAGYGSYNGVETGFRVSGLREALYGEGSVVLTKTPQSQTAEEGSDVVFSVAATGKGPLSYQWKKNGVAIRGAIGLSLQLFDVTAADAASYSVTVTGQVGAPVTAVASLLVSAVADVPPAVGLSFSPASPVAPATIVFTANATDAVGSVTKVELFQGTTSFGVRTQAPFTWTVPGLAAATYAGWTAVATNNSGMSTTSAPIAVTVAASSGPGTPGAGVPHIAVVGVSPLASGEPGVFTFTRSGADLSGSLTIFYHVGGSAIEGADYTKLPGYLNIKAGRATKSIHVVPISNEGGPGAKRSVKMTVDPYPGHYILDTVKPPKIRLIGQ